MTDAPEKDPVVNGITRRDYMAWRHHPVTEVFLRYLADKREFLTAMVTEQFIAGRLGLGDEKGQTLRGQIIELAEIAETPFEAFLEFYAQQQEEADGA